MACLCKCPKFSYVVIYGFSFLLIAAVEDVTLVRFVRLTDRKIFKLLDYLGQLASVFVTEVKAVVNLDRVGSYCVKE